MSPFSPWNVRHSHMQATCATGRSANASRKGRKRFNTSQYRFLEKDNSHLIGEYYGSDHMLSYTLVFPTKWPLRMGKRNYLNKKD